MSEVGGWVQPGNRFRFRFVRACARSGCRVGTGSKFPSKPLPLSLLVPRDSCLGAQVNESETKRGQVRPSETKCVQVSPCENKWSHVRLGVTKWNQVRTSALSETKRVQVRPNEATWNQMSLNESKFEQLWPSESKWDQVRPSESKWDQLSPTESPPLPPILLSNLGWLYQYGLWGPIVQRGTPIMDLEVQN